jgi:hypothetical protein
VVYSVSPCVRNSCSERILAVGFLGLVVRDSDTLEASDRVRFGERSEQPTGLGRSGGFVRRVDNQQCHVDIGALVAE